MDEKDILNKERLTVLYNRVLQKRNPNTDAKASDYDIDAILEKFKKLNEDMVAVGKSNSEFPIRAVIDYLIVELLEIFVNNREAFKEGVQQSG